MNPSDELLEKANQYSGKVITKREATNIFGTKEQQAHYQRYNKFKSKRVEERLLKTLDQLFESIEIVKNGVRKDYRLGNARDKVIPREDGRVVSQFRELPHTKYLEMIILLQLFSGVEDGEYSITSWLKQLELVNPPLSQLKKARGDERYFNTLLSRVSKVPKRKITNPDMVKNEVLFFLEDLYKTERAFLRVLDKLNKDGIIFYERVYKASLIPDEEEEQGEHVTISEEMYNMIQDQKNGLLKEHGLTKQDLFLSANMSKSNAKYKKIQAFEESFKEFLSTKIESEFNPDVVMRIKFLWTAYVIEVIGSEEDVLSFIERRRVEFLENYKNEGFDILHELVDNYNRLKEKYLIDVAKKEMNKLREKYNKGEVVSWEGAQPIPLASPSVYESVLMDSFVDNIITLIPYFRIPLVDSITGNHHGFLMTEDYFGRIEEDLYYCSMHAI